MNRHQILTGAVNAGDSCYSVGSVEGVHFTAYATGCDIVILASDFSRVQIIPGAIHGNIQVKCIDCSSDTGKIAASYDQQVLVFEPTPLLHHTSPHKLDYQWYQTACLKCECFVNTLSWDPEGTRLLVGGSCIQLWQSPNDGFSIGFDGGGEGQVGFTLGTDDIAEPEWTNVWKCYMSSPVYHLRFSPDGLLFASCGKFDRLVKIWYENRRGEMLKNENSDEDNKLDFSFCFIAHPLPVIDFSWRRISKYMPRGTVTNVLMTWAKDNICRLWSETVLPDDGLVDVQQFDLKAHDPKLTTTRHKNRFVHKLGHIRHAMNKRRKHKKDGRSSRLRVTSIATSENSHDFHKYWMQQNGLTPVLHFHLAATVNPTIDIPLNPSVNSSYDGCFIVNWMNNKELQFTLESEKLMNDLNSKSLYHEEAPADDTDTTNPDHSEKKKEKKPFWSRISSHSRLTHIESENEIEGLPQSYSVASFASLEHSVKSQPNMHHDESLSSFGKLTDISDDKLVMDESFDRNIEKMLKEWHNSPDILFAIHPSDGSFLVWSVDYLDEIEPGCFRQAQVTFRSKLPRVLPVCDAMSVSPVIMTYSHNGPMDYYHVEQNSTANLESTACSSHTNVGSKSNNNGIYLTQLPHIYMLTKHLNGSLNLWKVSFGETSKYRSCVSLTHSSRVCGHRFRTNSAASHPVLPLLITTSHHNLQHRDMEENIAEEDEGKASSDLNLISTSLQQREFDPAVSLTSELILWRVDPIGPLGLAGGITELAKISSPNVAAFDNVAWLPALLPSSALGSSCNSPSSLFVASDGVRMRLYLAVVDAKTLLADNLQRTYQKGFYSPYNSDTSLRSASSPDQSGFSIVSEQSTSRPGCIIELDALKSAQQDWTCTQLLHVYQAQLITGSMEESHSDGAYIDLRNQQSFKEKFFLVVLERSGDSHTYLHMWEIIISSLDDEKGKKDAEGTTDPTCDSRAGPQFKLDTNKVYGHKLSLPDNVQVLDATPAAGHLSSSNIYPACFSPYLFATSCTDGFTRFWSCRPYGSSYMWHEWQMAGQDGSSISVPGRPISVCCAYTGRIAIAYRLGAIMAGKDNPHNKYVNLYVSIYECESTGGSEWVQEDVLELKNICIPDPKAEIDLSCILGGERKISHVLSSENFFKLQMGSHHSPGYSHSPHAPTPMQISPSASAAKLPHVPSIPSLSTIQSVKRCIAQTGNKSGVLQQKHLVQLDWAPTEDGGHILTVAVGSKILFFSPVSSELASNTDLIANIDTPSSGHPTRPVLQKSVSMTDPHSKAPTFRWLRLRNLELSTADGLPPLPMHVSWAKDGVLIVGMDNEMHVYSQWIGPQTYNDVSSTNQICRPSSSSIKVPSKILESPANGKMSTLRISQSVPHLHRMLSVSKVPEKRDKKELGKRNSNMSAKMTESLPPLVTLLQECGLFEAIQVTNPVLPQYHPKQLLELLNFGKVKRVKAILSHLMHCIGTENGAQQLSEPSAPPTHRSRAMSVHTVALPQGKVTVSEETSAFIEISSIPPLPLYCLVAADSDSAFASTTDSSAAGASNVMNKDGYIELFSTVYDPNHEDLDLHLADSDGSDKSDNDDDETDLRPKRRNSNSAPRSRFAFGHNESEVLSNALVHVRLPGLNNLDQMYLMALADTVAHTHTDFSDRYTAEKQNTADMDDCGLRYIVSVGHHNYLTKTLPPGARLQMKKHGLPFSDIIWAFHSESEQEILNALPCKAEPTWDELKLYGVGWFIKNINVLRQLIEKVAKSTFQLTKDPLDSALFYLAMKKKMLIWGLFRSISDEKMMTFFKNDFSQDRWRKAALKNAYALLGLQRFTHAAAFFLLAGCLKDAVDICLHKLMDVQLAIVIARLFDSDVVESGMTDSVKEILANEVFGGDGKDEDACHPNPFLRSLAYWMCKQYKKSLSTLLAKDIGLSHPAFQDTSHKDVSVFNFYNYLRTHPLLLRHKLVSQASSVQGPAMGMNMAENFSPTERRLFFMTAHDYIKAGCPALALEVLIKLPLIANLSSKEEETEEEEEDKQAKTAQPVPIVAVRSDAVDWGAPVSSQKAETVDWGAPVSSQKAETFDWGAPAGEISTRVTFKVADDDEPPSFSVMSSDSDSSSEDEGLVMKKFTGKGALELEDHSQDSKAAEVSNKATRPMNLLLPPQNTLNPSVNCKQPIDSTTTAVPEVPESCFDIMAQQLKFVACLKIAMEELATLATGFEVEGGQLRYQLYVWLEKQVEVMKVVCKYDGQAEDLDSESFRFSNTTKPSTDVDKMPDNVAADEYQSRTGSLTSTPQLGGRANLHEVITADRLDFEAKQMRMARRKQWLKRNQQLICTLLTYCSLYGASGGGLACIKMELILLLQELQQDRTQKQLLSPLPFPTTLPLLSASVAASKTVVLDPISYVQSFVREMLGSIVVLQKVPDYTGNLHHVVTLRNLSTALSSSIYECLCDSDSLVVGKTDSDVGLEGFTGINTSVVYKDSYLMAGAKRKHTFSDSDEFPSSPPSKWPGTSQLVAMLARDRDPDAPKLSLILCESLFAVYMSVFVHALTFYETNVLFRLAVHVFNEKMWSTLFGGGMKTAISQRASSISEPSGTTDSMSKARAKFAMKVGVPGVPGAPVNVSSPAPSRPANRPIFDEKFIPPKMSMINYIFSKPQYSEVPYGIDYDSDDPEDDAEEHPEEEEEQSQENEEHMDPHSFSWTLMRLAMLKLILHHTNIFLALIGYEPADLPSNSALLHSLLKTLEAWEKQLVTQMDRFNVTSDLIPGLKAESSGPKSKKYKSMLHPDNTPFRSSQHAALPCRRLWFYLINQEPVQDLFIRYLFGKKSKSVMNGGESENVVFGTKIIHKDPEVISTFCINSTQPMSLAIATHKDVLELNISNLLNPPTWLDTESDDEADGKGPADFVYVPERKQEVFNPATSVSALYNSNLPGSQTGRGTVMTMKHPLQDVKKLSSHPIFPCYLAGSSDGAIRIYDFGHEQAIQEPRAAGKYAKPTRLQFNAQGNKFGVTDAEGYLSLFQVGFGTNLTTSYLTMQCHNKITSDFLFISSSSLLATAGLSSDGNNIGIWDTLLPTRSALIQSFRCHDSGSTALLYAPQHQLLVAGGKRGDVSIFDLRQRKQLHTFPVHESSVRCMALDPCEEFFVTGSADGDIKVWGLSMHQVIKTYTAEHSKTSMFSRTQNSGVLQLHVTDDGLLYSAGADGTLKVRLLSEDGNITPPSMSFSHEPVGSSKSVTFSL